MPKAAIVVVGNDHEEVLMLWRHRFVSDRWVWKLLGGYLDERDNPAVSAAREAKEDTGWRPAPLRGDAVRADSRQGRLKERRVPG